MASSQPPPSAKPATAAITGLRACGDAMPVRGEIAEESVGEGLVRHLLDVGAGRKCFFRAGDDHAADVAVGLETVDGVSEFAHQRAVERVERLRAVEPDEPDPAAGLDDDGLGTHGRSLKAYFWHTGQ